jgi:acyl CoA:acetate/3-ketoacid CoA transferase alpha subunit
VAEGKEVKEFDGEDYILERGIRADLSIIKGWRADEAGNLQFRKTARNFNFRWQPRQDLRRRGGGSGPGRHPRPDAIHLPSIYVKRMIVGAPLREEDRVQDVRQREAA